MDWGELEIHIFFLTFVNKMSLIVLPLKRHYQTLFWTLVAASAIIINLFGRIQMVRESCRRQTWSWNRVSLKQNTNSERLSNIYVNVDRSPGHVGPLNCNFLTFKFSWIVLSLLTIGPTSSLFIRFKCRRNNTCQRAPMSLGRTNSIFLFNFSKNI